MKTSAATVRPARPGDAEALGRLGAMLVAVHHDFDPSRFFAATPDTAREYGRFLAGQLERPEALVLAAEEAGEVVGYSYASLEGVDFLSLRGPAGVIYDLMVDPEWRGRGIGRRLLDATVADLLARGAPRVVLSTAAQNTTAQGLFAARGFRRTMIEMTLDAPPEG